MNDSMEPRPSRRDVLRTAAALGVAAGAGAAAAGPAARAAAADGPSPGGGGRLRQSVCRWCFPKVSLEDLAAAGKGMGLVGIDLLTPKDFPVIKAHGLVCTMTNSHPLQDGLCDPRFHDACLKALHESIEATAREGWKNVICFSGNRRGIDDRVGLENCAKALKEIVPEAEKAGVTVQMELLNSKVNHKDYMCDRSDWGVELVKRVGSDHFKLLYDVYHMQIMEGDVIRTIEANHEYFGHYHTGGNPGRHEIDDSQELNYKAIARAVAGVGYGGFFAHEFLPTRDPLTSLREAVTICNV